MSSAFLDLYPNDLNLPVKARAAFAAFTLIRVGGPLLEHEYVRRALDLAWAIAGGSSISPQTLEASVGECGSLIPDMDELESDAYTHWVSEACVSTLIASERPGAALNAAAESWAALFEREYPESNEIVVMSAGSLLPRIKEQHQFSYHNYKGGVLFDFAQNAGWGADRALRNQDHVFNRHGTL